MFGTAGSRFRARGEVGIGQRAVWYRTGCQLRRDSGKFADRFDPRAEEEYRLVQLGRRWKYCGFGPAAVRLRWRGG
jgi:hypothetical protein